LALGCDCLGHIHYFDAVLNDSSGAPFSISKVVRGGALCLTTSLQSTQQQLTSRAQICMHEEDAGLLYKHVDYRTGHSESRRSRRLVLSFIATVVNYEYLFYWYFHQDGSIEYEIKLTGELSTNLLSEGEEEPAYGTLVAPRVNAQARCSPTPHPSTPHPPTRIPQPFHPSQVHQHMFCARLDMCVDGPRNCVSEVRVEAVPRGVNGANPFGNAFHAVVTPLRTESAAQRVAAPATVWRVSNPRSLNPITGKPVAYKIVPHSRGGMQPLLLTAPDCAVTQRGQFATKALWVTPWRSDERFPAGECVTLKRRLQPQQSLRHG